MNDNQKKKKIVASFLGIFTVLLVLVGVTYAYWILTLQQEDTNVIETACLNITMDSDDTALSLRDALPISDFEGMQTEGYAFTVTNTCDRDIDYRIDLDSLLLSDETMRLKDESVSVLLDYGSNFIENNEIPTYADLESAEVDAASIKDRKILAYDTVLAGETNTHTLRLWLDETSTIEDESKEFQSKVRIISGQGIEKYYTDESCFTFDSSTGTITAYDEVCGGPNLVIPYKIGDVPVTIIGNNVFSEKNLEIVEIPRSVEKTNNRAFWNNNSLNTLILKDGLVEIGLGSFALSINLSNMYVHNIIIPSTVTQILNVAFQGIGLQRLVIPDNVISIGAQAFSLNHIKELKLGLGLSKLVSSTFMYNNIEDLVIPGNIKEVGTTVFVGNLLKSIVIEDGVTTLGTSVFYSSNSRTDYIQTIPDEIYVPSSVTKLSYNGSFRDMPTTTKIYFDNCKENVEYSNLSGGTQIYKTDGCATE